MATAQANAIDPAVAFEDGEVKLALSKSTRIRMLNNELESAWCCSEGLVPVRSPCRASLLCFVNIILPGFGTIISACCASQKAAPSPTDPPAGEALAPEALGEEEQAPPVDAAPVPPPVVSVAVQRKWSAAQAVITGIAQLLTAGFGLGWIWSISHGLILYENAKIYKKIDEVEKEPDDEIGEDGDEEMIK